jgi:hypothetical protein
VEESVGAFVVGDGSAGDVGAAQSIFAGGQPKPKGRRLLGEPFPPTWEEADAPVTIQEMDEETFQRVLALGRRSDRGQKFSTLKVEQLVQGEVFRHFEGWYEARGRPMQLDRAPRLGAGSTNTWGLQLTAMRALLVVGEVAGLEEPSMVLFGDPQAITLFVAFLLKRGNKPGGIATYLERVAVVQAWLEGSQDLPLQSRVPIPAYMQGAVRWTKRVTCHFRSKVDTKSRDTILEKKNSNK